MEEFPSGQRGQTVNLLRFASVVRIHPPPPARRKRHIACDEFFYLKTHRSLILLLLASKPDPLALGSGLVAALRAAGKYSASVISLATSFLFQKTHRALILLLLASKPDPLAFGSGLVRHPPDGGGQKLQASYHAFLGLWFGLPMYVSENKRGAAFRRKKVGTSQ